MRLNQGIEWATHACALLAALGPEHGLSLAALAEFHGVPQPYMAKQMQALSQAGIVRTARGRSGGYALARPVSDITLGDIAAALGAGEALFRCTEIRQRGPCAARKADCAKACPIASAFVRAEDAWREVLDRTTIASLVAEVASGTPGEHIADVVAWLQANAIALPAGKAA